MLSEAAIDADYPPLFRSGGLSFSRINSIHTPFSSNPKRIDFPTCQPDQHSRFKCAVELSGTLILGIPDPNLSARSKAAPLNDAIVTNRLSRVATFRPSTGTVLRFLSFCDRTISLVCLAAHCASLAVILNRLTARAVIIFSARAG